MNSTRMANAKELVVLIGPRRNQQQNNVQLNGVLPEERLTPKMARRAARIAHGVGWSATVWDMEYGYGYRLYEKSARKLCTEE